MNRRSALNENSQVVSRLIGQAEARQEQAQTSGRGRPGHAGTVGRDKAGRAKATYDISLATQERLRAVAEEEGVVISDLVELAVIGLCTAVEAGLDLHPFKTPTRNLRADWKLEAPQDFSFCD